uniref:EF-hand domain-containing protein n=1 Tax=Globisporangium ultimum (strain ATCC 200006 / CBS 805.95 / DAOM BR144) TaxID=431595 RepID=K3X0Y5_GLOUD
MKSPTAYGSENEETSFIRRIATPDRAGSSRKQKNRLAVAGATIGLIAASAVVGYTALREGSVGEVSIPTEQLEASTHAAAANSQFVTPLDDSFYPSLEQLDADQNGAVSQTEYLNFLEKKKDADIAEVEAANLPKDIADDLIGKINANFDVDGPCVVRAMRRVPAETEAPATTVVVDTPSGPVALDLPIIEEGEPTTTIVIDTPSGPTVVEIPVVTDDSIPTDEIVVETPSGPVVIEVPAETEAPETTVVVDTPSGPVAVDIPAIEEGEPTTTVVIDTPSGPTEVEIPVVTDENVPTDEIVVDTPSGPVIPVVTDENVPTDEIVVDTPSGPIVIELPSDNDNETSAPETTVVVDTPSGPVAVDIPAIEEGEPTTTVVVDTPTGPVAIEIPVVTDDSIPTDEIVVDTPSGPVVIEVPIVPDTPVVTPAPDNTWMTKEQFKQQIGSYFESEAKNLEIAVEEAEAREKDLTAKIKLLGDCIEQAANKFGWYGVYEKAPHFQNAVTWVTEDCTKNGN